MNIKTLKKMIVKGYKAYERAFDKHAATALILFGITMYGLLIVAVLNAICLGVF